MPLRLSDVLVEVHLDPTRHDYAGIDLRNQSLHTIMFQEVVTELARMTAQGRVSGMARLTLPAEVTHHPSLDAEDIYL